MTTAKGGDLDDFPPHSHMNDLKAASDDPGVAKALLDLLRGGIVATSKSLGCLPISRSRTAPRPRRRRNRAPAVAQRRTVPPEKNPRIQKPVTPAFATSMKCYPLGRMSETMSLEPASAISGRPAENQRKEVPRKKHGEVSFPTQVRYDIVFLIGPIIIITALR